MRETDILNYYVNKWMQILIHKNLFVQFLASAFVIFGIILIIYGLKGIKARRIMLLQPYTFGRYYTGKKAVALGRYYIISGLFFPFLFFSLIIPGLTSISFLLLVMGFVSVICLFILIR